jgi:hypothetical protein
MQVTVYNGAYQRLGTVPDYVSCSVTWQRLGVGSGVLAVAEDDPVASYLLQADENVVGVVVDVGFIRWSGRVATVTLEREGPPGSGVLTATLVDDWVWLQWMLASQNGANPVADRMPQFDTPTGPGRSVAADYINAAATRLGLPVVATKPAVDSSPRSSSSARMTTLADLLTVPLARRRDDGRHDLVARRPAARQRHRDGPHHADRRLLPSGAGRQAVAPVDRLDDQHRQG